MTPNPAASCPFPESARDFECDSDSVFLALITGMAYSERTMIEQLSQDVTSLIDELHDKERAIEETYLSLGELFPRLVGETDASSRTARESLDAILGALDNEGRNEMEEFLALAARFFNELRERDKTFLVSVNAGVERLSTLDEIIGRVRLDSEEMEIVSLNALTAALKSGSAGRAFSVITDELKQISAKTIATTVDISARGQKLLESFRSLGDDLRELAELQERFFEKVRSTLTEGFSALEARVRSATDTFASLARDASGVKDPIVGIMQGVQVQDILRQSIDHVLLSLKEIKKDGETFRKDELVFAAAVAELSVSVLNDVIARIDEGVGLMSSHIDDVVAVAESADQRRQSVIASYEDIGIGFDDSGERVEAYLKLKGKAVSEGRDLSSQVMLLNDSFKVLYSLLNRLQNIVVASRIEIARTRALSVVSNTVAGMIEITENLGADVGAATDVTKAFIKTASADISSYDRLQTQSDQELTVAVRRMESELGRLQAARERVKETISSFRLYTPDFLRLIQNSRSSLSRLSDLSGELGRLRDRLESVRRGSSEEAETMEGEKTDTYSMRNERLRQMVERFTIFTHKKAAGALGDFQVEEGVESGQVTLF